jgi:hypothetical protein
METLREEVLPAVASAHARGQLWAVVDVLNNLRDRVEEKRALQEADAEAARAALEAVAAGWREAAEPDAAAALERELAAAPAEPAARAEALRARVDDALRELAIRPATAAAGEALRGYLVSQAIRDVAPLKPSLLSQISRG